jgi:hypothetical protein
MVVTDVSGQPIGPIFKGQAVQEEFPSCQLAIMCVWMLVIITTSRALFEAVVDGVGSLVLRHLHYSFDILPWL